MHYPQFDFSIAAQTIKEQIEDSNPIDEAENCSAAWLLSQRQGERRNNAVKTAAGIYRTCPGQSAPGDIGR